MGAGFPLSVGNCDAGRPNPADVLRHVEDGANGVLFEDAASLARELAKVSGRGDALEKLREGASLQERWGGMWARCVAPVVAAAFRSGE